MKLKTLIASLALAALTFVGCASAPDHTRASIVRITTQQEEGTGVCTGFVVQTNTVLTAAHCVGNLMQADGVVADLIEADPFFDLAAIRTKTKKVPLVLRDTPVVEGESLVGIGYAWGASFALSQKITVLNPNFRPSRMLAAGIVTQGGFYHGMSGGPVIDSFGHVVSIVQLTTDRAGFGVGVTIIRAFLLTAGITL